MELIHADANGTDIELIKNFYLDMDIGSENDFELTIKKEDNYTPGDRITCVGTEFGGVIGGIKADTTSSTVVWAGSTWRGLLEKKIIEPPTGQAYRVVTGSVKTVVDGLLNASGLSTIYAFDETTLTVSNIQLNRYITLLDSIQAIIGSKRLNIEYKTDGYVHLSAVDVTDFSETIEFSNDNKINVKVEKYFNSTNHLICLGKGELTERTVVHLYADANGNISQTKSQTGLNEYSEVYDNNGAEDINALIDGGTKRLKELVKQKVEVTVNDVDVNIGDIIGGREYKTNTYVKQKVTQKILRISDNTESIEYKVGE